MILRPAIPRSTAVWTYRLLWLCAIALTVAMPLVILVRGDLLVGSTTFDAQRRLTHSLILVGGDLHLQSNVDYPVVVIDGNVYVDGTLNDDVVTIVGNIFLDSHTQSNGNLVTLAGQVFRAPGAQIQGTIGSAVLPWTDPAAIPQPIEQVNLIRQLRFGLALAFGLLLLCLVSAAALPWSIVVTSATAWRYPIRSSLAGVSGVVAVPLLLLPLTLSLIGLPLAVLLSFAALAIWVIGLTSVGFLVGRFLLRQPSEQSFLLRALITGLTPILLLLAIPVLGPLLVGTIGIFGAGARILSFVERDRAEAAVEVVGRSAGKISRPSVKPF